MMKLFAKSDLARRWGVSKQRLNGWSNRHEDFPKPFTHVNEGHTPLFTDVGIEDYESKRKLLEGDE